ncbi:MAG: DUF4358 domain-containing protein [Oscillospiraceae bacterium]|nr:DUF4358 domain-containing protein [Oscillospiraceae bacterium]
MKKFTSAALAAIVLAMTLTGCGDTKNVSNNSSNNSSTANESTSTTSTESNESTGDESTTESTPDENSDPEGGNGEEGADNSNLEYPDNKAGRMVKSMLTADAWSFMMLMDAETAPVLIPDFSIDDCEEYCLAYCGMSAQLQYAIAVKPKAGSEKKVEDALATFYDNVKNNPDLAFYPMQQAAAEGAVMDTTDDGYICIIVHENGQTIGDTIDNVQ